MEDVRIGILEREAGRLKGYIGLCNENIALSKRATRVIGDDDAFRSARSQSVRARKRYKRRLAECTKELAALKAAVSD